MKRYLRSNTNGIIFEWNKALARNPAVVEVTEKEAYPERFAPVDLSKRQSKIDMAVPEEIANPPANIAPELLAEASKPFGLGQPVSNTKPTKRQGKPSNVLSDSSNIVGLIGEI